MKKKYNNNNNNNDNNNNDNNNIDNNNNNNNDEDLELTAHKKKYISPEERQHIINELRLVPKKDSYFKNYLWINVNFKKHISIKER